MSSWVISHAAADRIARVALELGGKSANRLCDVDERGRSTNVCDGRVSATGADALTRATAPMWPTAYRFRRGNRIRVQVSSGAFPRFNRNLGSGEPRTDAVTPRAAHQQIFHDRTRPR
jgi:predicted acyl esterase